ncbi:MAG: hypothetical protein D3908_04210 [Candidatus Electrothrix sp. AUS4]|nr:hypothetical protein [Candidatus Electrothrix sp. AUS4]
MQVVDNELWDYFKDKISYFCLFVIVPYLRRMLRFIFLPYAYFFLVNWEECTRTRFQVAFDFLYIFFVLKYFPDNYSLCRLWEKDRAEWIYYYGSNYDPYQRRQLRKEVQKKEYFILFEDKNICYQLCQAGGLPLPKQYGFASGSDDIKKCLSYIFKNNPDDKVIVKPTLGKGGKGICLCSMKEGQFFVRSTSSEGQLEEFGDNIPAVLQKYITQHEELTAISPSTNTVRLATLLTKNNNVLIIGAKLRLGVGNSFVDNSSKGGISVGINTQLGALLTWGQDFNSLKYERHPTSQIKFKDFKIPMWQEVVALAEATQRHFSYFKLLGHDIAITSDGPVIIELNAIYDNVALELASGPILNNKSVLMAYYEYGLLINSKQRKLCI